MCKLFLPIPQLLHRQQLQDWPLLWPPLWLLWPPLATSGHLWQHQSGTHFSIDVDFSRCWFFSARRNVRCSLASCLAAVHEAGDCSGLPLVEPVCSGHVTSSTNKRRRRAGSAENRKLAVAAVGLRGSHSRSVQNTWRVVGTDLGSWRSAGGAGEQVLEALGELWGAEDGGGLGLGEG